MKYIFLIAFVFIGLNSYSQECHFGNDQITSQFKPIDITKNFLLGIKVNLCRKDTLVSLNLIGTGTGADVKMVVYDDSAGIPNNLIATSGLGTVGNGLTSFPIAPQALAAGDYWVMAVYKTTGKHSNFSITATKNDVYYTSLNVGQVPPKNASGFTHYTGQDFLYFLGTVCSKTPVGTDVITACNSHKWINGKTYISSNDTSTFLLKNAAADGCDSLAQLELTILKTSYGIDKITECDSLTWLDGTTYTTSNNIAKHTLKASNGCDSIVTLNLIINKSGNSIDSITACNWYKWKDGKTYNSSNNTAKHIIVAGANNGCDSILTLHLTIKKVSNSTTSITDYYTLNANNSKATYQWLDCGNNFIPILKESNKSYTPTINGNYAVELTENGCKDTSSCIMVNTVGIKDNSYLQSIKVYPNPAMNKVTIESSASLTGNIRVKNALGAIVMEQKVFQVENLTLDVSHLSGIYFLEYMHYSGEKSIIKLNLK